MDYDVGTGDGPRLMTFTPLPPAGPGVYVRGDLELPGARTDTRPSRPAVLAAAPGVVRALILDGYGRVLGTITGPTQEADYGADSIPLSALESSVQSSISAAGGACVRAKRSMTQMTIGDSTWDAVGLNAEDYDTDGFHDNATNNSRLTVPSGKAGKYHVTGSIEWTAPGVVTAIYQFRLRVNATTVIALSPQVVAPAGAYQMSLSTDYELAVGDYVQMEAYTTISGGSAINNSTAYSPVLAMHLVG